MTKAKKPRQTPDANQIAFRIANRATVDGEKQPQNRRAAKKRSAKRSRR